MLFTCNGKELDLHSKQIYVAGWTGRNRDAVDHHINELAELGISPPSQVPLYYRISNNLLTQNSQLDVLGDSTSGEVEPFLIQNNAELFIGLASDHTDRQLESYSVAASKQACPKPVSNELWKLNSVIEHLDSLILRCMIKEHEHWVLYQEGTLANISPLLNLVEQIEFKNDNAMLCGTLAAIGGVRPAQEYRMELVDPVLNKTITLSYTVNFLPIVA